MRMQRVILDLLLKQPFYGYIAASVIPVESCEIPTISIMTSPYIKLLYNAQWFDSLKEEQAVGAVLHELLHLVLLHPFRKGERERNLWITACDMAVNEHIDPALLPSEAVTVSKVGEALRENLPRLKSAEFYYDFLFQSDENIVFAEMNKQIRIILKSGLELTANDSTGDDSSEVNRNAMKSALADIMEQARAEGEIPGEVEGFITELYTSHDINWRNVLKRFLSGKGKVLKTKTFKRESKRFENLPGNKRSVGTSALLALDESGSVSDIQVSRFYNELAAIKGITGAYIRVTEFDTECTQPVPLEMYTRERKRSRNGGTDFRPVFELADKLKLPLLIIFTDGDGPVPESVNQKVLWVLTKVGKRPAPYGYCVNIEI